jgi:hypothetical protein
MFLVIGLWFLAIGHASGVVCANAQGFGFRKPDKLDKLNFLTLLNSLNLFALRSFRRKKRVLLRKNNSVKLLFNSVNAVVKKISACVQRISAKFLRFLRETKQVEVDCTTLRLYERTKERLDD